MNKALARSVVVGMGVVFAMGCQEITPSEVESPNFSHANGIWIEIVECWGEEVKDEVGGSLGTINIVCATRVVFIRASTTTPDEPPPPPDDWDEDGGAPGDGGGEDGGPTDEEEVEESCIPSLGNKNGCLRAMDKDERAAVDLARSKFKDPRTINDPQIFQWCGDAVAGVTSLLEGNQIWAGFNDPSMEPHGAQSVPADRSPNGKLGMHVDDDLLRAARSSSHYRRELAKALLHESWHIVYTGLGWASHLRGFYINRFTGEVTYRDAPYSEINKCLK